MDMNVKTGMYTIQRNGEQVEVGFNFYTNLKASSKLKFVNSVVDLVVNDKSYSSIIKDMMFDFEIINIFTDVDLTEIIDSPNNLDKIEDFLSETNIVSIVVKNADEGLIESLRNAVDDNISYKTGIRKNPVADAISNLLNTLESQIKNIDIDKLMLMAKTMSSLTGDITPEKILDSYANTDIFKQHTEDRKKQLEKRNKQFKVIANKED